MHKVRIRRSRRRPATLETPREERSLPEESGSLPRCFNGETSRRDLKVAALCALGLHFALFFVVLPSAEVTPIRVDERRSATVLQRWEPPAASPRPERRRDAKKTPVPIPDPTPRDPEPIFDATTDAVGLGETDAEFSVGLPESPPGRTGARARAVGAGSEGLLAPQLLQKVVPEYPPRATRSGIQGRVYIEAVITETGAVIEPELISGLPDDELNQRALAAVQRWKFKPGMKEGQPVMVVATFVIDFNIH